MKGLLMTNIPRFIVVVLLTGHGLIHLLGAAKGFGWAEVTQLSQPIGPAAGVLWLARRRARAGLGRAPGHGAPTWWWAVAGAAAVISQVAIATSWSDAKAGTVVNVLLVLAAAYGFASVGPTSFHAQWQRPGGSGTRRRRPGTARRDARRTSPTCRAPRGLRPPLRRRRAAAGDQLRAPTSTAASAAARTRPGCRSPASRSTPTGRARSGSSSWTPPGPGCRSPSCTCSTDTTATMRVKLLSLVHRRRRRRPGDGPRRDRHGVQRPRGAGPGRHRRRPRAGGRPSTPCTSAASSPTATRASPPILTFNARPRPGRLRLPGPVRASADGKSFTTQELVDPALRAPRRPAVAGSPRSARAGGTHRQPEGDFTYLEFHLDDINYNVHSAR